MSTPLPIVEIRDELKVACAAHRRIIIQAPTGSGKSTQIPQYLLDDGSLRDGKVVVLQPRRLATRLLANRVAHERGVKLGEEVGYQIRFEDVSNDYTRIKYETEGILLRQLLSDPEIRDVDAILFDEFHERHLYGDIMLARAVQLQQTTRPDLLILVMSATLDTLPLQEYLSDAKLLTSEGRTYDVDLSYRDKPLHPRHDNVMEAAAEAMEELLRRDVPGDALIFMPGAYEIQKTIQALQQQTRCRECLILPLHGELPPQQQDAAVDTYAQRKIIVSTNVAETSVTIDGIRMVIDSGLARVARFDPHRSINTLWIEKISRASADQRAGRAGRTAPGHCFRLWTEREHGERPLHETPEIRRVDLSEALLNLKAIGLADLDSFPWFEPPDPRTMARAVQLLEDLGAIEAGSGEITALGRKMASFPMHPRYARMLLAAETYQCVRQVALVAALTQGRTILTRRPTKNTRAQRDDVLGEEAPSDFFRLMRAWHYAFRNQFDLRRCQTMGVHAQSARQVHRVYESFLRMAKQQGLTVNERAGDDEQLCKCVLAGFADQVAQRRDQSTRNCVVVHGRTGQLSADSVVEDPLFVAAAIDEIQRGQDGNVELQLATRIESDWLKELFPSAVKSVQHATYDPKQKRVTQTEQLRYHDLVLDTRAGGEPAPDRAAKLLAEEVRRGNLAFNQWDDQVEQWILRLNNLVSWCPDWELPAIGDEERTLLTEQLCLGCVTAKEVRTRPVWPVVKGFLSAQQLQLLQQHAPERLDIGGKRAFRLVYTAPPTPPSLSARIQELFGVKSLPTIAGGRIKPLVHLLAPNQRPVQITQDLANFWREHYPGIRKELKRRYPKHAWPEDPEAPGK